MTRPLPPDGDWLRDMAHRLPPEPPEPPTSYEKRHPVWSAPGLALLQGGVVWDEAARRDDEVQDAWDADETAEDAARAKAREQHTERRALDNAERRIRVKRALDRERRRQAGEL